MTTCTPANPLLGTATVGLSGGRSVRETRPPPLTMSTMHRRDLLAALGTAMVAGCSGTETSHGDDSAGDGSDPVTVETIDAPGSDAGTLKVPASDRVTFLEFFATTCSVCEAQMSSVRAAYERVGDEVQFLSVTSEPVGATITRAELASWWDDHGGSWPVGIDYRLELARRYDATSVPKAVVVLPTGRTSWGHTGRVEAATIVNAVRAAREETAD